VGRARRPRAQRRERPGGVIARAARRAVGLALAGFAPTTTVAQNPATVPWTVGEYLEYDVKFGAITAGSGRMKVVGMETVRGRPAWHLQFNVSGGIRFLYRVNDSYDSWLDVENLNSLRFIQDLSEGNRDRQRIYDIFPDRVSYLEHGKEERPSVPQPLDDASFFYFIRSIPLEVGKEYEFNRYFDPRSNPVIVRVLRRERIAVPAGEFEAVVLQPLIKTSGIFSEGGRAEIWLSDDKQRILLQMKSKLPFGSLNLYLRKISMPDTAATRSPGTHP
jgi:hypothetical protein